MLDWSSLTANSKLLFAAVATASSLAVGLWIIMERRKKNKELDAKYQLVGSVGALYVYPIKSCIGMDVQEVEVSKSGFRVGSLSDRHFVMIRANGEFLTQHKIAMMSAVKTSVKGDNLVLSSDKMAKPLNVPLSPASDSSQVVTFRFWGANMDGQDLGDEASAWLSEMLEEDGIRLVTYIPGMTKRQSIKSRSLPKDKLVYQSKCPLLVTTEASLADLVARIPEHPSEVAIKMANFRPNIVIKGTKAWDEDSWQTLKVGTSLSLRVIEPCDRCLLTTVDPTRHERRSDGEPLKTLRKFRMFPEFSKTGPMFGVLAGVDRDARIQVGDPVYALRK